MGVRRKGLTIAASALLAVLVTAAPTSAAVSFQVIPRQSTLYLPGANTVTYDLRMTTNAEEVERFAVRADSPPFSPGDDVQGSSLGTGSMPAISGAGSLAGGYGVIPSIAGCSRVGPGFHGLFGGSQTVYVVLPPSSSTTLTYRFGVSPAAPWRSTRYGASFRILREAPPGFSPTIDVNLLIPTFEPGISGRSGVEIRFRTKPRSASLPIRFPSHPPAEIRKGKGITVKGSTEPALRRQTLRLMTAGPEDEKPNLLAKMRTTRKGKFRHSGWKPKEKGPHELWVEYRSQRDHLASDFTCSRQFELVGGRN